MPRAQAKAPAHVPANCTVIVKGILPAVLPRFQDMVAKELSVLSVYTSMDKSQAYSGTFIAFLNFGHSTAAAAAQRSIGDWMQANGRAVHFSVQVKKVLPGANFAVFVGSLPAGTETAEISEVMQQYGALDATRPVAYIKGAEGVCFVNFQDYASAKSVEAAAKPGRREVRMHNALLTVSPARNTTFIDALLDDLRLHGLEEFDMAYAARVAADMPKDRWPPKAQDMARLCRQVGEHFVADVERPNMFLAIDVHGGASLGLSVVTRSTPTSSPRTSSPELSPDDRRAYKRRLAILTNFLHDNCDILQTVFNVVWQRARAKREEAEIIAELSQRGVEVGEWVYEWDIPMLCLAITTPSFNETLRQWDVLGDGCGHGGRLLASLEVLVRERVLREGDVEERYSTYIRQWRQGPLLATCTIRLVRNILCHRPGSCPGLSGAAFDELFWLARNAFGALVCVSAEEAEDIAALFQDRCKLAQDAAFADDDTFFDAASSVASVASAGSCMSEWPAPSGFEPLPGSRAAVAMWSKGTVLEFFAQKNFPTAGVEAGEIDGPALLELMDSPHAEALFTAPVPDGLGFNRIMYHGRFRSEFRAVCGDGGA